MNYKIRNKFLVQMVRIAQIVLIVLSVFLKVIISGYLYIILLLIATLLEIFIPSKYRFGIFGNRESLFSKTLPAWIESLLLFVLVVIIFIIIFNI